MANTKYDKPYFMVIGAQKSGTSWLYQYFKDHPEVRSPPVKEFHFFDESELGQNNHWYDSLASSRKRGTLMKCAVLSMAYLRPDYLAWGWQYAFMDRGLSDKHLGQYARLFRGNLPSGDITPAYATLQCETVTRIAEAFPQLKIIYVMRNPVDRLWSATKMHYLDHKGFSKEQLTEAHILAHFDKPNARNDFLQTMATWESVFPSEQIFYGFYDELQGQPDQFIERIERFLGLAHIDNPAGISRLVGTGEKVLLTSELEAYLYNKFYPMLEVLSEKFSAYPNNPPANWLAKARQILANTSPPS